MADSLGPCIVSLTKCCGTANEPDAPMCTQKEKTKNIMRYCRVHFPVQADNNFFQPVSPDNRVTSGFYLTHICGLEAHIHTE